MSHILLTRRETALDRPTVSAHQDYAAATLAMLEEIYSVGSEGDPDESATLRVLTRDHRLGVITMGVYYPAAIAVKYSAGLEVVYEFAAHGDSHSSVGSIETIGPEWNIDHQSDHSTVVYEDFEGTIGPIEGSDRFAWSLYRDDREIASGNVLDTADAQKAMERIIRENL
ncbi:hypothetical protein [Rhodococcus opacus]|uniref:hypothetical protein n=1 Tax=Rhodococcus opacus TaxID=37919 RepID=UPI000302E83D|nr:hypothetical protein [Rhodococcus opacus]AHK35572.1 hypothetical protein Pd630_LPD10122 [Rhodococcus opacus PD630]UDH01731.1 hypothetical protein K2Z90_008254 [Rhodococcus opacus PD630]